MSGKPTPVIAAGTKNEALATRFRSGRGRFLRLAQMAKPESSRKMRQHVIDYLW